MTGDQDYRGFVTDTCTCPKCCKPFSSCVPQLCANGKCRLTGECVEQPQFVLSPPLIPGVNSYVSWAEADAYLAEMAATPAPRRIVAFTGLAGSGKSTAAMRLVNAHGFARVRFAGPLKAMCAALGLSPDEIDGHLKEVPCELLGGKTPRWAQQSLGTEWGRQLIGEDLWIRAWRHAIAAVPAGQPVVVDDCRFPNEAAAVLSAGGTICRVERAGAGAGAAGHVSEQYALPASMVVQNDGPVSTFLGHVSYIFAHSGD